MRQCPNCGIQYSDDGSFCSSCGSPLSMIPAAPKKVSSNLPMIILSCVVGFFLLSALVIVLIIAIPNFYEAKLRSQQKRAVSELKTISIAVQAYYMDKKYYPVYKNPGSSGWHNISVRSMEGGDFTPDYLLAAPSADPWKNQYIYGFTNDGQNFFLACGGADGLKDNFSIPTEPTITHCFNDDIVLINGEFIQYPEGKQKNCHGSK